MYDSLGRSYYQEMARKLGRCSQCYKNSTEINPKTGLHKWKCSPCEKKQTDWQRRNRKDRSRNGYYNIP